MLQALALGAKDSTQADADKLHDLEGEVRNVKIDGFFPTPPELVEELLDRAGIEAGHVVLEPSAGIGTIADAIRERHGVEVHCIELRPKLAEICKAKGHETECTDIFDVTSFAPHVDRIVMNPPFERGADFEHVRHCYGLLRPGGRLVAVVARGAAFTKKIEPWLEEMGGTAEPFDRAFSGGDAFRQTGVSVAVVVIDKAEG